MQKLKIRIKGGVKASRNNPKCYRKQNQKEIQSGKKTSFLRKHLSLESSYDLLGILKNLISLLKVLTSGDISKVGYSNRTILPEPLAIQFFSFALPVYSHFVFFAIAHILKSCFCNFLFVFQIFSRQRALFS